MFTTVNSVEEAHPQIRLYSKYDAFIRKLSPVHYSIYHLRFLLCIM